MGSGRRAAAVMAVVVLAAAPVAARADTLDAARDAFDSGRYDRAAEIWRELARDGDPEAAFRLGLISDLGLGRAPDAEDAFGRYLEAARRGHAAAQFNAGVMLDAGTGGLQSSVAAATWYARAAARGFARAQYNLALLYAEGTGLPRNLGLAAAWSGRAADTLPAARAQSETLRARTPEAAERPIAPVPVVAEIAIAANGESTLDLVWTAGEQPPGTYYRVEFDTADGDRATGALDRIAVSAVSLPVPAGEPRRWRVLATDGTRVEASDWQPLPDTDRPR